MFAIIISIAGYVVLAIAAFRFILMCRLYIKTGEIGEIDNTFFFSLFDYDCHTWPERMKALVAEPHPIAIVMDIIAVTFVIIILALIATTTPIIFAIVGAVALFIITLRWLRARFLLKEEFVERLKGEYDGD